MVKLTEGELPSLTEGSEINSPLVRQALELLELPALIFERNYELIRATPLINEVTPSDIEIIVQRAVAANKVLPEVRAFYLDAFRITSDDPYLDEDWFWMRLRHDQSGTTMTMALGLVEEMFRQREELTGRLFISPKAANVALAHLGLEMAARAWEVAENETYQHLAKTYLVYFAALEGAFLGARTAGYVITRLTEPSFEMGILRRVRFCVLHGSDREDLLRLQARYGLEGYGVGRIGDNPITGDSFLAIDGQEDA